ncbi:hypothetical protein E2C01_093463 [Portunus trituberculatus]|uniref:Uncharacterized protein n=1 Tax=Portunus trituberculatus TaxID=210409 RepID=A0A5B7JJ11_PORTR|nr:hypothetical protein [Portunus trituberculatus]
MTRARRRMAQPLMSPQGVVAPRDSRGERSVIQSAVLANEALRQTTRLVVEDLRVIGHDHLKATFVAVLVVWPLEEPVLGV